MIRKSYHVPPLIAALTATFLVLLAVFFLDRIEQQRYHQEVRLMIVNQASTVRARIEGSINSRLYLLRGLAAQASLESDMTQSEFAEVAEELLGLDTRVSALALARDGIISHIWPREENLLAVGLNVLELPETAPFANESIAEERTVFVGPLTLPPGREGFIGGTPIFVEQPSGEEKFWGFASLLIPSQELYEDSRLDDQSFAMDLAIASRNPLSGNMEVFYGPPELFDPEMDSVITHISLLGDDWRMASITKGGWPKSLPTTWAWRTGGVAVALLTGMLIWLMSSAPKRMQVAVDEATSAYQEAEKKYRDIFENARDGIFQTSPDGRVLNANPKFLEILGYSSLVELQAAQAKKGFSHYVDPNRREEFKQAIEEFGFIRDWDSEVGPNDGTTIWVRENARAVRNGKGEVEYYEGTLVDVTDLRTVENRLRMFERAVEQSRDGILVTTLKGKVLYLNKTFLTMHGYEPDQSDELKGEHFKIFNARQNFRQEALHFLGNLERHGSAEGEAHHVRRDGSTFPIWMAASLLRDESGKPWGYVTIARDISERRKAEIALQESKEDALKKAESLIAINRVADSIYHDLDMRSVAEKGLEAIVHYLPSSRTVIYRTVPETQTVELMAARGFEGSAYDSKKRGLLQQTLVKVLEHIDGVVVSEDLYDEMRMGQATNDFLRKENIRQGIFVPLVFQNQTLGALVLLFSEVRHFGSEVKDTLLSIGRTIGLALANAHHVSALEGEVAERKRAETALLESETRYKTVSEMATDFAYAFRIDPDGSFHHEWITEAFERTTGFTAKDMETEGWGKVLHPEDREIALMRMKKLKHLESVTAEYRIISADGEVKWLRDHARPVLDEATGAVRIFGAASDITKQKKDAEERDQLEDQLRHAQKMEAIGTLAGGIAHDFNNLLSGIMGYASLLKIDAPDEATRETATIIETTADRASHLTKQLLGFARRGKMQNVEVDLHGTINEVEGLLSHDKRIKIEKVLSAPNPHVQGDPDQMQQIILNLALNARDAMLGGGKILIGTEEVTLLPSDNQYTDLKNGKYVVLSVSDTGAGIPPELHERVFEPFFTTKEQGKGVGMGLAMVYGIATNHGGGVHLYSEVGRGTTFKVYLPVSRGKGIKAIMPELLEPVRGEGRVMVVDDEAVIRDLVHDMLESLGYDVVTFDSAADAIDYFEREHAMIDLVILDMVMPDMGGRECYRALSQIAPSVRAILSSGYSRDGAVQEILDEGMDGFIQKPFRMGQLSKTVSDVLKAPAKKTGSGLRPSGG